MLLLRLWCRLMIDKYKLTKFGWVVLNVDYGASGLWKLVLLVKSKVDNRIRYRVHIRDVIERLISWHIFVGSKEAGSG